MKIRKLLTIVMAAVALSIIPPGRESTIADNNNGNISFGTVNGDYYENAFLELGCYCPDGSITTLLKS